MISLVVIRSAMFAVWGKIRRRICAQTEADPMMGEHLEPTCGPTRSNSRTLDLGSYSNNEQLLVA